MVAFSNIALEQTSPNFSFGPVAGRAYSIDSSTDVMTVKTLAGTLVATIPLNVGIFNQVESLEYDGFYFYALSKLGAGGTLGVSITKWLLSGSNLIKQISPGDEIILLNAGLTTYSGQAFSAERYVTNLTSSKIATDTIIPISSTQFLELGMSLYIGPSTASSGEIIERTITGIAGNNITLNAPLGVNFNNNDKVIYRRNLWFFNDKHLASETGSLIQINSYDGSIVSTYSSTEWKHVTAATFNSGNLCFVRNFQLLRYKLFGANTGYQNSAILNNVEVDNQTIIKVEDIEIDASNVYKLQSKQHQFDTISFIYSDVTSTSDKLDIEQELITPKVSSITAQRNISVLFGISATADLTINVRDQYNVSIFGRSFSVNDDDPSGFITPGLTSFTTNVSGNGNTRYNSGITPTFRQPTVTAIDLGTLFRANIAVDQLPSAPGSSTVEQRQTSPTACFVVQDSLSSLTNLEQGATSNSFPIEQSTIPNQITTVEQYLEESVVLVQQDPLLAQTTLIQQDGTIEETTIVTQYDFLIFALPLPYSIKNPVNTNILVRIIGFGSTPLNSSTLIFKVNGINVTSQVVITSFGAGLELFYNPILNFSYASTVTVEISIDDTALIPRTVSTYYTFGIVPDLKKPIILEFYPPDQSVDNLPLTEVYAIIQDLETSVDLNSIQMFIEGKLIAPTIEDLGNQKFKVSYQTDSTYFYKSQIGASILVSDDSGNKTLGVWNFNIKDSSGVLFTNVDPESCDKLVPLDTNFCVEAFGLEDGINLDSLEFNVDGKDVTYVINPKVYRKT